MHRYLCLIAIMLTMLCACTAELQNISSGQVGCSPRSIEISNEKTGFGSNTWTASCNGETYYCERINSEFGTAQVSCKESAPSAGGEEPQ